MRRVASVPLPTASAVSVSEIVEQARAAANEELSLVQSIGLAATIHAEQWTQRAFSARDAVVRLSCLPSGSLPLWLNGGQVNSLTSLTVDGTAVDGLTVVGDSPALVVPSEKWPSPEGEGFPVVVSYNVGYSTVPEDLRRAILLIAAELYDQRRNTADSQRFVVPMSAEWLMARYRIRPL